MACLFYIISTLIRAVPAHSTQAVPAPPLLRRALRTRPQDEVIDELLITLRNHNIPVPPEGETQATLGGGVHPARLLEHLGLGDKAAAYPRDLSTGERQRVALGAITVTRPGALLLDEPTRGMDYAAKRVLVELLQGWRGQGMAIMLVTHDVELAAQVADRVALIEEGQIKVVGRAVDVLSSSAAFMPQMAQLFPGRGWLTVADVLPTVQSTHEPES